MMYSLFWPSGKNAFLIGTAAFFFIKIIAYSVSMIMTLSRKLILRRAQVENVNTC
jgi:hypothetical protein